MTWNGNQKPPKDCTCMASLQSRDPSSALSHPRPRLKSSRFLRGVGCFLRRRWPGNIISGSTQPWNGCADLVSGWNNTLSSIWKKHNLFDRLRRVPTNFDHPCTVNWGWNEICPSSIEFYRMHSHRDRFNPSFIFAKSPVCWNNSTHVWAFFTNLHLCSPTKAQKATNKLASRNAPLGCF